MPVALPTPGCHATSSIASGRSVAVRCTPLAHRWTEVEPSTGRSAGAGRPHAGGHIARASTAFSSRRAVVTLATPTTRQQAPSPQLMQPQEGERVQLKRLYQLNQVAASGASLEAVAQQTGLDIAGSSATSVPVFQSLATDTFDDYEDMQGAGLADVKKQDPRSVAGYTIDSMDAADLPNSGWAPPSPMESTDPAWDDRVPVDASIDGLSDVIGKYGDGAAGVAGQQYGAPPPALRQVAAAAAATAAGAARAYARVAESGRSVAQAAAAAMAAAQATQPSASFASGAGSSWLALDDTADGTRNVVVLAGADAKAAVLKPTVGLVAFEGLKHARISQAVLEDARQLFMQLMPAMIEASEAGLHVCLTGQGAGGSLATVLALMCANHGLNPSGFSAVVFDAPPVIGEDAADEWYEQRRGDETQDDDVIDEILSRGLMSTLNMPSSSIKSVIVQQDAAATPASGNGATNGGASVDTLVAQLNTLATRVAPGLGLPLADASGQQGGVSLAHWTVSMLRGLGGKQVTLFKPLGTVLQLHV